MTSILSKPDHGVELIKDGKATPVFQAYLDEITTALNDNLLSLRVQLTSYTVATVPDATTDGGLIFVSDDAGGGVPAFSEGGSWRRVTDRTIVAT